MSYIENMHCVIVFFCFFVLCICTTPDWFSDIEHLHEACLSDYNCAHLYSQVPNENVLMFEQLYRRRASQGGIVGVWETITNNTTEGDILFAHMILSAWAALEPQCAPGWIYEETTHKCVCDHVNSSACHFASFINIWTIILLVCATILIVIVVSYSFVTRMKLIPKQLTQSFRNAF